MSAAALLAELEAAGVRLSLAGDDLRFQTRPGVSIAPYRESIAASKPALLAELRWRNELAAMGLDPTLRWARVYRGPVKATTPPADWQGIAPAGCGVPHVCRALGPCPHFTERGHCWEEAGR